MYYCLVPVFVTKSRPFALDSINDISCPIGLEYKSHRLSLEPECFLNVNVGDQVHLVSVRTAEAGGVVFIGLLTSDAGGASVSVARGFPTGQLKMKRMGEKEHTEVSAHRGRSETSQLSHSGELQAERPLFLSTSAVSYGVHVIAGDLQRDSVNRAL